MSLYPRGTSSEKVVKTVLMILKSQQHKNIRHLMEGLNSIDSAYINELCRFWESLIQKESQMKALAMLTTKIKNDLSKAK